MDLLPTEEQEEIVGSIGSVLADRHTLGEPMSDQLWASAGEQGWFGLGISEAHGGVGYGIPEEVLLYRELGIACAPGPFLATTLGAHVAAAAGAVELLGTIVGGEARISLSQRHSDSTFHAFDLDGATHVLTIEGDIFALYEASQISTVEKLDSFDTLVPVTIIAELDAGSSVALTTDPALALRANLLVSAYLGGIASATTAQSVSYGMDREQFGQPIGGFQAVKHRCADMATRAEVASSQALYASLALRDGAPDAAFHVHATRVVSIEAAISNARINVQNHGGIGFTWEHTAHRFVTRADVFANVCGNRTHDLAALLSQPAAS